MTATDKLTASQIETLKASFGDAWEAEVAFYARAYGENFVAKLFPRQDGFLARWNIHKDTWAQVKCKANVKKIVKALGDDNIERIYISPAFGSVYIDTVDETCIRISDHERTSSEHARPCHNVFDNASFNATIEALTK